MTLFLDIFAAATAAAIMFMGVAFVVMVMSAGAFVLMGVAFVVGVILDNAPYIALLAIVAFGGVALILNKRRRDEE